MHGMADKVLCDEAMIHHVKERTRKKIDHHTFQCWAFSKAPSRIPQTVFLTFVKNEIEGHRDAQVHFVRHAHVFKVLIHIVVVEDLMFYHYPRQELIDDGKIPRREFVWRMGHPDEDLDVDDSRCLSTLMWLKTSYFITTHVRS
jgi:hypothetical protein